MALEDSPLQSEIDAIVKQPPLPVNYRWKVMLETPERQIMPLKLFSIDIERRYNESFSDNIIVDAIFGLGEYTHNIYPYRKNLVAVLGEFPKGELNEAPPETESTVRRYRAVLLKETSDSVQASSHATNDKQAADLSDIVRVQIQLVDLAVEQLLTMTVGGIYRNELPIKVVRYLLTQASEALSLPEEDGIRGVDIVEPDNVTPEKHIIFEHGVLPMDVPTFVQDFGGGVYNAGMGTYLQDGLWYVYPEFSTDRFDATPKTATIINIPPMRYRGIERTYRLTHNQVILLATGDSSQIDDSNHDQINRGNGVRFTHGDQVMNTQRKFAPTENNQTKIHRGDNNSEFRSLKREGLDYAPVSKERITNNPFAQTTQLARRQGMVVSATWENSKPTTIYPGMPVKYLYLEDGEVKELEGCVLQAHHYIHDLQQGVVLGDQMSNTALVIFLERKTEE